MQELEAIYAKKSTDYQGKTVFKLTTPYLSKGGFGVYITGPEPTLYVHSCSKIQLSANMEDAVYLGGSWDCANGLKVYIHMSFAEGYLIGATLVAGPDWWEGFPETCKYRSAPDNLPSNFRDPRVRAEYFASNPDAKNYPNYRTQTDLFAAVCEVFTEGNDKSLCYFIPSVTGNRKFYFLNRKIWSDLLLSVQCTGFQLTPAAADTPCVGGGGGGDGGDGSSESDAGELSDGEIKQALLGRGGNTIDLSQFSGGRIDPGNPGFGGDIAPSQQQPQPGNPQTGAPVNSQPSGPTVDSFSETTSESIQLPVNTGDGVVSPGTATQTTTTEQSGRLPDGTQYSMTTQTVTQVSTDGSSSQAVVGSYSDSAGNNSQWGWGQQTSPQ